jgi:Zn finger protein HypA/HybF involved in hydrogenase expression
MTELEPKKVECRQCGRNSVNIFEDGTGHCLDCGDSFNDVKEYTQRPRYTIEKQKKATNLGPIFLFVIVGILLFLIIFVPGIAGVILVLLILLVILTVIDFIRYQIGLFSFICEPLFDYYQTKHDNRVINRETKTTDKVCKTCGNILEWQEVKQTYYCKHCKKEDSWLDVK